MRPKEPSRKEKMRAVRYMRHRETCRKCNEYPAGDCIVALGHYGRWARTWEKEVYRRKETA